MRRLAPDVDGFGNFDPHQNIRTVNACSALRRHVASDLHVRSTAILHGVSQSHFLDIITCLDT